MAGAGGDSEGDRALPGLARRRFLVLGLLGAAGSVLALVRTTGYPLDGAIAGRLRALSAWQYLTVQALAERIAAPDWPTDVSIPSVEDAKVVEFIDDYLASMDAPLRRDVLRFVGFVEQLAPLGSGFARRFTRLSSAEKDEVLGALAESSVGDLRAGFDAVKSLVMMGYYRDPRTWRVIGYEGPFVQPKEQGG